MRGRSHLRGQGWPNFGLAQRGVPDAGFRGVWASLGLPEIQPFPAFFLSPFFLLWSREVSNGVGADGVGVKLPIFCVSKLQFFKLRAHVREREEKAMKRRRKR